MAEVMKKLTRSQFIPFLDVANDKTFATNNWKRIDKSTIFDLGFNPESTSNEYIDSDLPEEEVEKYAPELEQEMILAEGHPIYDFIFNLGYNLSVGDEVKIPYLLVFGGSEGNAWRGIATILVNNLNTVDKKISFTLKFNSVEKGTVTVTEGAPTFTPAE